MNKKHNTPPHNMAACRIKKILASTMQFSNTTHTTTSAEHSPTPPAACQSSKGMTPQTPNTATNQAPQPPAPPPGTNTTTSDHHPTRRGATIQRSAHPPGFNNNKIKLLRKEVIQPHLPVRLPCYDFVPIADPTFDGSLTSLGHQLRVLPTFMT